ncbi:hypothetical protein [Natrinema salaciae]|uniref:hypothetical protein n=1 Tax=Natrinema salaciae TaxID=1186196 RepID=UPI0015878105|nr:hypothetical protein [Natrinema salaciae]
MTVEPETTGSSDTPERTDGSVPLVRPRLVGGVLVVAVAVIIGVSIRLRNGT